MEKTLKVFKNNHETYILESATPGEDNKYILNFKSDGNSRLQKDDLIWDQTKMNVLDTSEMLVVTDTSRLGIEVRNIEEGDPITVKFEPEQIYLKIAQFV